MSVADAVVTAAHLKYVAEHTVREDAFLADLRAAARDAGLPPISIGPAQGSMLQILVKLARAREIVEVGTLGGYSAIWMARALPPGGRVRTVEYSKKHATFARDWIGRSDVAGKIEVIDGAGADILPTFVAGSADAAFLDADKCNYPLYLEQCRRIVRKGGLIAADNAFAFGELFEEIPADREVGAIRAFNEIVPRTLGLHGIIIPLGDGCWVCVNE